MKILITSLLLFTGLNQILARSLPWNRHNIDMNSLWEHDDYDLFHIPPYEQDTILYDIILDDIKEQAKEKEQSAVHADKVESLGDVLGSFLGTIFDVNEEDTNSEEKPQVNSDEDSEAHDDKKVVLDGISENKFSGDEERTLQNDKEDKSSEEKETKEITNSNENSDQEIEDLLTNLFGKSEEEESKGKISEKFFNSEEEDKSSEEKEIISTKNSKSNENSDQVIESFLTNIFQMTKSSEEKPEEEKNKEKISESSEIFLHNNEDKSEDTSNEKVEINDMTKSSEEQKEAEVINDLSTNEINELATFVIALNILSDLGDLTSSNKYKDDNLKAQEADEMLLVFDAVLEEMLKNNLHSRKFKPQISHQIGNNEKEDMPVLKTISDKKESSEEDDDSDEKITTTTTTIPTNVSNENEAEDDANESSSNENEIKLVSFVLPDTEDEGEQQNLNEHKYSVIQVPTSAPFLPESVTASNVNDQNSVQEYVEIRENLDTQQNSLQKHELDLDKDFYNIISSNYDDKSLQKFETDIYQAHENLDRIKRNINAMQNLQSKLYFHKLVTSAVENIKN